MKGLYEQTILPEPFRILNKDLKPFSFGHFIILRRFDVGFVQDEPTPLTLQDIVFSVLICSKNWEQNSTKLYSGELFNEVSEWAKEVNRIWPEKTRSPDFFGQKANLFHQYLAEHTIKQPFKLAKDAVTKPREREWFWDIFDFLFERYQEENKVMNLPWARGYHEFVCSLVQQGSLVFKTNDEVFFERKERYLKAHGK